LLIEDEQQAFRDSLTSAALICAVIANVHRDPDRRPFTPADFMPGAKTEEDDLREFAEAVMRGETFAPPSREELAKFRSEFVAAFTGPERPDA
jgi:hypothetical protein